MNPKPLINPTEDTPRVRMLKQVAGFSEHELRYAICGLEKAICDDYYADGVTIGDFLEEVNAEMFRRGLSPTDGNSKILALIKDRSKMYQKLASMSDKDLETVWSCLDKFNPSDMYDGEITMTEWANAVYVFMNQRGLKPT
ncbi:MAG: hypothetical protein WC375_00170 [Methanomassiliicoccales archaeon]|jgi:hypothetical protein